MQICPPEKNKYFVPTKCAVKKGEKKPTLKFFNISEILESKLYQHVIELSTYFKYANLFKIP